MEKKVYVPISPGELLDKISILNIKKIMVSDVEKIKTVKRELLELMDVAKPFLEKPEVEEMYDTLVIINRNLWMVEDNLRQMEADKVFDDSFVEKARSVYRLNDRRYDIKHKINVFLGSTILEVKEHPYYE